MSDMTLQQLTDLALRFRDERDWKQFHNPKDLAIVLSLEAAEVLEHMLWKTPAELDKGLIGQHEQIGEELSDVLHAVMLLASELRIDLGEAYRRKMAKNAEKYPIHKSRGRATKYTEL